MINKQQYFRSKKLLNLARECPHCMMCNKFNDGTIVAAHYQGYRQHELGKGTGIKPTDSATAFLCSECHDQVDGRDNHYGMMSLNPIVPSEEFLFAILKTHDWLLTNNHLKVV